MRETRFYQEHLDRVSRSFAFCIEQLESPFRERVSLAYLLCRTLDTIEDSPWTDPAEQVTQYEGFARFLAEGADSGEIARWARAFPRSVPEGERLLLEAAPALFEELHALPSQALAPMRETVARMGRGMRYYSLRPRGPDGGRLRLSDLVDVNRYCYFVAGVVGELLSALYLLHRPDFRAPPAFATHGLHFGLFLQKINLLKDQGADEREGRFLVPDRELLLASLRENARGALAYLQELPPGERGYRLFCAWSLFLGAASLPWMGAGAKIPRSVTRELLTEIERIVHDNEALARTFAQGVALLPEREMPRARPDEGWFLELASGSLSSPQLEELRMR